MNDSNSSDSGGCTVCGSTNLVECVDLADVPVYCNAVCSTRQEALEMPRGRIRLMFCRCCGHIFNQRFDPARLDYAVGYENSLHASARFRAYAQKTADHLIRRYDLHAKQIVEIGAGRGEFLALLMANGHNRGLGLDPSYAVTQLLPASDARLEFIADHYSRAYADRHADLICCRHVLEHIATPRDLLAEIHKASGNGGNPIVFFEVPNVLYTLRDMGIWDIIYEHCSYFSPQSLQCLFNDCGFAVQDLRAAYDEQFLCIEAFAGGQPAAAASENQAALTELARLAAVFRDRYGAKVKRWEHELASLAEAGRRVAVWGSGSKGVTFLNTIAGGKDIDCVVDINPRKQGRFIPGTAQMIAAPAELTRRDIDQVLVMNPVYRDEIESELRAVGSSADIACV